MSSFSFIQNDQIMNLETHITLEKFFHMENDADFE